MPQAFRVTEDSEHASIVADLHAAVPPLHLPQRGQADSGKAGDVGLREIASQTLAAETFAKSTECLGIAVNG